MDVPDPTIRVFDGVGARDGDVVVEIKGTRQRRLLALLTIRAGTVADVDWLSECLWDDGSRPDDTMPPVRTAVYRLQDIVQSWAPDPLSSASLTQAVATFRFVTGTYTCELGQQSPFDLQPCEMTDSQLTATYEVPFEPTGTFEGSGTYSGVWLQVMRKHARLLRPRRVHGRGRRLRLRHPLPDRRGCAQGSSTRTA